MTDEWVGPAVDPIVAARLFEFERRVNEYARYAEEFAMGVMLGLGLNLNDPDWSYRIDIETKRVIRVAKPKVAMGPPASVTIGGEDGRNE
ncbi:MAG TPA: hypothetical protein VFK94_06455 [Patescibacteria group bacterium]|nr:hypothetical protein [Patescibacteria group bacterium]